MPGDEVNAANSPVTVGGRMFRASAVHHTRFKNIPIRGFFVFDPELAGGPWVKTGTRKYAKRAANRSGQERRMGNRVTTTGKTQFFQGQEFSVDTIYHKVIEPNPSEVVTEQDKRDW